jgi:hypothetical protein
MLNMRALLVVLPIAVLGAAGCLKTSGGGVMELENGGKATLGFQAACRNVQLDGGPFVGRVTGNFQFKDRDQHRSFHTKVDYIPALITGGALGVSCEEIDAALAGTGFEQAFAMVGAYTPQPTNSGPGGTALIIVGNDPINSIPCQDGDVVQLQLAGGVYDGYSALGCVDRGNITVFTE